MSKPDSNTPLRVVTLLVILANIAFNYAVDHMGLSGDSVAVVSARYHNSFTPADYASSIWGLIYAAFIAYGVAQLLPRYRRQAGLDGISALMLVVNLLAMSWVAVFRHDELLLSSFIVCLMLAAGIALYERTLAFVADGAPRAWLWPSSLFLGWISVATIASFAALCVSRGFHGGAVGEAPWAMGLIVVASAIACVMALRLGDFVFPLVVAWAAIGIGVESGGPHSALALTAFICAGVLTLIASAVATTLLGPRHPDLRWPQPAH
jgi:translocator protein